MTKEKMLRWKIYKRKLEQASKLADGTALDKIQAVVKSIPKNELVDFSIWYRPKGVLSME